MNILTNIIIGIELKALVYEPFINKQRSITPYDFRPIELRNQKQSKGICCFAHITVAQIFM